MLDAARWRQAVGQLVREDVGELGEEGFCGRVLLWRRAVLRRFGAREYGEDFFHIVVAEGSAEPLDGERGEGADRRRIVEALERANEARGVARCGANGDGSVSPTDHGVVFREPRHAENGVVALQRRGGERGLERNRSTRGSGEGVIGGDLSRGRDNGTVGELDRAIGREEFEAAACGEGRIDESLARGAAVQQQGGGLTREESPQLEQRRGGTANSMELQRGRGRGKGDSGSGSARVRRRSVRRSETRRRCGRRRSGARARQRTGAGARAAMRVRCDMYSGE